MTNFERAQLTVADRLRELGACSSSPYDAVPWSEKFGDDCRAAWFACAKPEWLLWLAHKLGLRRQCTLALAICVARALRYVPTGEPRPRAAVVATIRRLRGKAAWDLRSRWLAASNVHVDCAAPTVAAYYAVRAVRRLVAVVYTCNVDRNAHVYIGLALCDITDAYVADAYVAERDWQCAAIRRVIPWADIAMAGGVKL